MNSLSFIDVINIMDFILQLQNMESSQNQIDEIRDVLQNQNDMLNRILEELNDRSKRD